MPKFMCSCAALVVALLTVGGGVAHAATLEKGDRGAKVERVQRALGVAPADGVFGPKTRRAVKRFQRRHGLTPDGVVGPATRRALGLSRARAASGSRVLDAIARCESGGNPRAVSPDGRYRGKYQFSRGTWKQLGGRGDPADAPEWLQDRLALRLYRQRGTAPWPSCG